MIDSEMTNEYVTYFTTHRFPRLTCPDEPELVLDEDDERIQRKAPK